MPVGLVGDPLSLGLFVRLALPKGGAVYDLSGKFGAPPDEAAATVARRAAACRPARRLVPCRLAMPRSCRLCIGVGACRRGDCRRRRPGRHRRCRRRLSGQLSRLTPPPLGAYSTRSPSLLRPLPRGVRLWAEPGRALVAGGGSVIVQVQLRRDNTLFVNDGVYGNLSDAGALGFRFPAPAHPARRR